MVALIRQSVPLARLTIRHGGARGMKRKLGTGILVLAALAAAQDLTVVSAASFLPGIAPESLGTAFGAALASETRSAELDAEGKLPLELAGVTLEVNGERAPLLFVSPAQINFLTPRWVRTGVAEVVVANRATARTVRGTAVVRLVAPGLFVSAGRGVIVNAVTWQPGPFRVETVETPGRDRRTRLAVFATGLRWAGNPNLEPGREDVRGRVRASLQRADGRALALPVEFAGPAAGFFGLDQVNVLLPPEADGFGEAALTLTVDGARSNEAPLQVAALPLDAIGVRALELPGSVAGGETVRAAALLNAPAPAGGLPLTPDSSDRTAANVPNLVAAPAGQTRAEFEVRTTRVATSRNVRVSVQGGGAEVAEELRIRPAGAPALEALEVTPPALAAGSVARATVSLSAPADTDSAVVTLAAIPARIPLPASVTIPFGRNSVSFDLAIPPDAAPGAVTVAATYEGQTRQRELEIRPPLALTLSPASVTGGRPVTGRVTVAQAAPASGVPVTLASSSPLLARTPAAVTVPPGSSSVEFTVETASANADERVTITAQAGAASASTQLLVEADSFGIESFTITPGGVAGGGSADGVVQIRSSTPVLGLISIFSSNMAVARAPLFVLAPRGQTRVQFRIQTSPLPFSGVVEFTVSFFGSSRTAALRVN
jgi:uncharacterized protein (TIGR03437 family)